MAWNPVLAQFVEQSPVSVMARLALQRAISADWVDSVFAEQSERQYTRELLFSKTVSLMSQVALGYRSSLHDAAQKDSNLSVSITSVYNKVNHTEPGVLRALVRGSAARLEEVIRPWQKGQEPFLAGYRVRIVDGNHLPASEKRLKPLRGFRGAARPGYGLVIYDPDLRLITDLEPCEDAHTQERATMKRVYPRFEAGELWMGDRNFSTRETLWQIAGAHAAFVIREHGVNPHPTVRSKWKKVGRCETGVVSEQKVSLVNDAGEELLLRRVRIKLTKPMQGGQTEIRILTNLPRVVNGVRIAELYRKRWSIEEMFQRLESVVHSEVRTLGQPGGALMAFAVSILAYNVLSVIQAAIEATHDLAEAKLEISPYYLATDVRAVYEGMRIAVHPSAWTQFDEQTPVQLRRTLERIARHVVPKRFRNHPRSKPRTKVKKGYAAGRDVRRHVSTARVLAAGKIE